MRPAGPRPGMIVEPSSFDIVVGGVVTTVVDIAYRVAITRLGGSDRQPKRTARYTPGDKRLDH